MNKARNMSQPQENIFGGVLLTFFVLFFHVILILGLAVLMLFFRGIIKYLPWIIAIGGGVIVGSGYLWWKHMKKRGKKLRDILRDPLFQGRTIEVSLLGGLASLRLGQTQEPPTIGYGVSEKPKQLQEPTDDRAEQLAKSAHSLKQDLITVDEFLKANQGIIGQ